MITDRNDSYLIKLIVPGFTKEEIKLELIDNKLCVSIGKLTRVYKFYEKIKDEEICAKLENGILEIVIPKNVIKKEIQIL